MSRSDPPPSTTAAALVDPPTEPRSPESARPRPRRRALSLRLAALARWLHVYLSMFGLAAVLFFSATGLTLNHPDWFFAGAERRDEAEGQVDPSWLHAEGQGTDANDPTAGVARLEIVEYLRATHGVAGALVDFRADEYECSVTFKGPGYDADAFIDRETGRYRLSQAYHGPVAVLNDLHKGRDTGPAWSLVIDLSAAVLVVISLSGLILLFYLKLRRRPGLALALVGTAAVVAVVVFAGP